MSVDLRPKLTRNQIKGVDFALKEFRERPQREGADFNRELKTLNELRKYPHRHIVTHLATWTQDGKYYMLFPYAQCNLRQYMKWLHFGPATKDNIMWLLNQLRGLAEALKDIHNLSSIGPSLPTPTPAPNLAAPQQPQMRKSGWHHDLKPENILLFKCSGHGRGTFQISDFGSGKIHTYRSGSVNTRSAIGTVTYEPPEAQTEGATSRPHDMWSLGCVFLELLIWAVLDCQAVDSFASERVDRRYPGSQTYLAEDDSYWQKAESGGITLRKQVLDWIERLKSKVQKQRQQPFMEVLELIIKMLDPDRYTRILALDLWNTLEQICYQKNLDLQDSQDDCEPESNNHDPSSDLPRLSLSPPDRTFFHNEMLSFGPNAGSVTGDSFTLSPSDLRTSRPNSSGSVVFPK